MEKKVIKKAIAQRLEGARLAAGYSSIEEFCEDKQLKLEEYAGHEKGKSILRASHAICYSRALGVSLQWLMLGDLEKELKNLKAKKAAK